MWSGVSWGGKLLADTLVTNGEFTEPEWLNYLKAHLKNARTILHHAFKSNEMNWIQEDGYITTAGPLRASIKYRQFGSEYQIRIGGLSAHGSAKTEEEAKQFGEEQLQIMKRAFILSLIVETNNGYIFGTGVMKIHEDDGVWTVYGTAYEELFEGTLEECKNYIVSCF